MSIKLMAAAWELDLPLTEKAVLLCLCDHANDDGECWPAMARVARRSSMSERTAQRAIKALRDRGILAWHDVPGRSHKFVIDPRRIVTPDTLSPPTQCRTTPDTVSPTPDTVSPKPSITAKEPPEKNIKRGLPVDWQPRPFGPQSKSAAIIATWPAEHLAAQVEHFTAHHRAKGSRFADWQDAWSTWVLNSRNFGRSGPAPPRQAPSNSNTLRLTREKLHGTGY